MKELTKISSLITLIFAMSARSAVDIPSCINAVPQDFIFMKAAKGAFLYRSEKDKLVMSIQCLSEKLTTHEQIPELPGTTKRVLDLKTTSWEFNQSGVLTMNYLLIERNPVAISFVGNGKDHESGISSSTLLFVKNIQSRLK